MNAKIKSINIFIFTEIIESFGRFKESGGKMRDVKIVIEPSGRGIEAYITEASKQSFQIDWAKLGYSGNVSLVQAGNLSDALTGWVPEFIAFNKVGGEVLNENNAYSFLLSFIGQYGYSRNIPVKIGLQFGEDGRTYWLNGYYLDFRQIQINKYRRLIRCPITDNITSFYDRAEALNLRALWNDARIKDASGKRTNYNPAFADLTFYGLAPEKIRTVLSIVPDGLLSGTISLAVFNAYFLFYNALKDSASAVAAVSGGLTGAIEASLIIAALLIFGAAMIVQIIALLKDLSDALFQKPKAQYCFRVKDIMRQACEYLGFTFKSTLLDRPEYRHLAVLAATDQEGAIGNKKPTNNPIPDKTLFEFLQQLATFFRAGVNIDNENKIIEFEEKDYFINQKAPVNLFLQPVRDKGFEQPNIDELPKTIKLEMLKDDSDNNSKLNKVSVSYEIKNLYSSISSSESFNLAIEHQFDFCLLERKDSNTKSERLLNTLYDLANGFLRLFRGGRQVFDIGDRRGAGLVSNDQIGRDRVFILDTDANGKGKEKIAKNSAAILSMRTIFNQHWYKAGPQYAQNIRVTERDAEELCAVPQILELVNHPSCYDQNGTKIVLTKMQQLDNGMFALDYQRMEKYLKDEDISVKIA